MSGGRLATFLEALRLTEYFDVLAREKIEPEDFAILSDDDLSGLGIPLGPRRRLLKAAQSGMPQSVPVVGERRNLTVLFCDMVGSTELASRLDPEDLRQHLRSYRDTCIQSIEEENGYVAHRLGDGIMAHFGFPRAMEDAALRAVRAALSIVERTRAMKGGKGPVEVRIGIASGLTVVEEARPGLVAVDEIATGATLSLAARLQNFAQPGTIVVSDATRRLLRDAVDLRSLGQVHLKGFAEEMAIWGVTRLSGQSAATGDEPGPPVDLLGRQAEYDDLVERWRHSMAGTGQVVIVQGEAGIGKSRLLAEIKRQAKREGEVVSLHCSPYRHGAALHPVTGWLEKVLQSQGMTDPAEAVGKLPGVNDETRPYLLGLLGVQSSTPQETDPIVRRDALVDAVIALLSPEPDRPRLLLVEDLQWADAATLDVLDRLMEMLGDLPLLLVASARPDARRLPDPAHAPRLTLSPLATADTMSLIGAHPGAERLAPEIRERIAERSGGVPFFTEELTRATLDAPNADLSSVPITLQDTLMARLDRLRAGKSVAQVAALIGPRFKADLLAACADIERDDVAAGLEELIEARLVERRSRGVYMFRHALLRETAFMSMLRSRRTDLHRRVAHAMIDRFPDLVRAQPETVAHHLTEAGELASGLEYWEEAAEKSIAQAALSSAITYFQKALSIAERLPASPSRDQREAALRVRLNMPLVATTGFASADTEDNLARMATLFQTTEPGEAALQLLWSRCMSALVRADLTTARSTALQMKNATEKSSVSNASRMPERILGYIALLEGELDAAEQHFTQVLVGYDPKRFDPILPGHAFDALASSLAQEAILLALRDRPDLVDDRQRRALGRARELDNPATSFQVLVHICIARFEMGDHDRIPDLLGELRSLVDQGEVAPLYADLWDAWLTARNGDLDPGLERMAKAQGADTQYPLWMPRATLLRIELLLQAGRVSEALELTEHCDEQIGRLRHTYLSAEAKRVRAACLTASDAPRSVVADLLESAVQIAKRQGANRFERLAREDLARLDLRHRDSDVASSR
ncbi:ATP-binding protein [Jannaschia aquimarina]|uniref:CyaB protein n=1 Tax=Jannaschia aquimarina TaxID=935700 RepID=A0A0D1D832_9RHOB|nr:AAA family ATPase [Jannaschia aquimarina]KIT16103.1 Adenylate cyclase 2 [Jannaschia aquimarina]SNT02451.1 SAM domain (Sterile alpha motif) [Jannaschia aquimarina]